VLQTDSWFQTAGVAMEKEREATEEAEQLRQIYKIWLRMSLG